MERKRVGFTIVELLIFIAIFSAVIIGFVTVLVAVTRVQSRQSSTTDVETQGQFLLQEIQYYVQSARLVDMAQDAATGTLQLREPIAASASDPTLITLASRTVYLVQGTGGALQPLTSNRVAVTNLSFARHYNVNGSSAAYGSDSVSYAFTVSANTSSGVQQYTQSFQSSAATLAPVPKIALIQQASATTVGGGVVTSTASYSYANASGSLLIAIVANTGAVSVSVPSDSAGNSWSRVASTSYAATSEVLNVFAALNAKNVSNTVTVTFGGGGATNPSLFLYEYRGAATSSSFDASAAQVQTSTTSFSSGSANPTSSVELLLSAIYLNPLPPSAPTPGNGFTIESSSSVSDVFIEDENAYITGPASASWTTAQLASSSVILVTFK